MIGKGRQLIGRLFGKKQFQYKCFECGKVHEGSPSFSLKYPTYYYDVPEAERAGRVRIGDYFCQIKPASDDTNGSSIQCIRAVLDIPIKGVNEPFTWGVWVTQSKESFEKYTETFGDDQSSLGSFGWLAVDMPFYNISDSGAPIEHLECDVDWGDKGRRPKISLWRNAHQLAVDQRTGISWRKATKIVNPTNSEFSGMHRGG